MCWEALFWFPNDTKYAFADDLDFPHEALYDNVKRRKTDTAMIKFSKKIIISGMAYVFAGNI